jgi:hypothetical protein
MKLLTVFITVALNEDNVPTRHNTVSGVIAGWQNWGLLLTSGGERPAVLLNTLQLTGQCKYQCC